MLGLEYVRKINGDTTISLAEKIKVVNSAISQWETGKKRLPKARAEQIAALYNVPADVLTSDMTALNRTKIDMSTPDADKKLLRKKLEVEKTLSQIADRLMSMEELHEFRITVTCFVTEKGRDMKRVKNYRVPMEENNAESTADKKVL